MLLLKILIPVLTLIAFVAEFGLDHWWHDKRTKKHRRLRKIVLGVGALTCVATVALVAVDDFEQQSALQDAQRREVEAIRRLSGIQNHLNTLETDIAPVVTMAEALYPALERGEALSRLADRVQDLEADVRARSDREQALAQLKATPPAPRVALALVGSEFRTVITLVNDVPIQANWRVVTKGDIIVSGLMLGDEELHPSSESRTWRFRTNIGRDEIVDGYLELRFRYNSVYWSELGKPDELKGQISKPYRLSGGMLIPL